MWLDKFVLSKLQLHAPKGTSPVWVSVGSQVPWAPEARLPWHFLEYHTPDFSNVHLCVFVCVLGVCVSLQEHCANVTVYTRRSGDHLEKSALSTVGPRAQT